MIRRIVVALDASERARGVFDAASEVARRFAARIWVVRVIPFAQEFPAAAHVEASDPLPAHLERLAIQDLQTFIDGLMEVDVAPPLVRVGQPWRAIIAVAAELDADLIVLGSHGYHGLDRVLGTTAAKVANLAQCHVFVVHNREQAPGNVVAFRPKGGT